MPKSIIALVVVLAAMLGGAYLYFSGKEYMVTFSENEIVEKVSANVPYSETYLLIFRVTLDNPRIDLEPGSDRINGGMDVTLNIKVRNEEEFLGGSIDISGGLRYQPQTAEFFLEDPLIEDLQIVGVPEQHKETSIKVMNIALNEYFNTEPIYSLQGLDAKKAVARMILKSFEIKEETIVVVLGI